MLVCHDYSPSSIESLFADPLLGITRHLSSSGRGCALFGRLVLLIKPSSLLLQEMNGAGLTILAVQVGIAAGKAGITKILFMLEAHICGFHIRVIPALSHYSRI
jgi:hypothetical protein